MSANIERWTTPRVNGRATNPAAPVVINLFTGHAVGQNLITHAHALVDTSRLARAIGRIACFVSRLRPAEVCFSTRLQPQQMFPSARRSAVDFTAALHPSL